MSRVGAGALAVLVGVAAIGALQHTYLTSKRSAGAANNRLVSSTAKRSADAAAKRSGDAVVKRPAGSAAKRPAGSAAKRSADAASKRSAGSAAKRSLNHPLRRFGRRDGAPIVIAHRGASAFRPEHTLISYETAIRMGADYIELDLVSTKDHVLVARHENELSATTDVRDHPEFADRWTTKTINGFRRTGWFTEDFTLKELRTLRVKERFPKWRRGNTAYNGRVPIPTLDEVVRLAKERDVGVYAETKFPSYFASIGLPLEGPLLETFKRYGWDDERDPVFIQSLETKNLKELRAATRLRLIQFIGKAKSPYDLVAAGEPRSYDDLVTPEGLGQIARYANGIGVGTMWILPADSGKRLKAPTSLVRDAHEAGLKVHVATVRRENARLPVDYRLGAPGSRAYRRTTGDVTGWLKRLYGLGVDGVFTDDPGSARAVRDRLFPGI
ncbi:glycerophosphodiester phosphodiesterase family protein [Streptosporangium sp. NPDC000396]|uniref:glycerophosphodiester phosphodiesterase n=1 Tax=Streptosporangium sp. NPDC000396 TaxID=3366185 RepID=UPI0036D00CAA